MGTYARFHYGSLNHPKNLDRILSYTLWGFRFTCFQHQALSLARLLVTKALFLFFHTQDEVSGSLVTNINFSFSLSCSLAYPKSLVHILSYTLCIYCILVSNCIVVFIYTRFQHQPLSFARSLVTKARSYSFIYIVHYEVLGSLVSCTRIHVHLFHVQHEVSGSLVPTSTPLSFSLSRALARQKNLARIISYAPLCGFSIVYITT